MIWVIAGALCRQGAGFFIGLFVARILGVVTFGKFAIIQSTVLMLASFCQAGIGLSTTKYIASSRSQDLKKTGRIIGFALIFTFILGLFLSLIVLVFSYWISETILHKSSLSAEFKLASGWMMFEMINLIYVRALSGLEAFRSCALYYFLQSIILLPIICFGTYYGALTGAIIAMTIASAINCVIGQIILRKECNQLGISISYRDICQEKRILRMSSMVWSSNIAMNMTSWFVEILLARQASGMFEFGLFKAADRFKNILSFFPTIIYQVTVPILASLHAEGNRRGFTRTLFFSGIIGISITFIGSFFLFSFSDRFMTFYGAEFIKGSIVLKILALGCIVFGTWTIAGGGLWATEQSKQMLTLDILRAVLLVVICVGGFSANAQNLAFAQLISYSVAIIPMLIILNRFIKQPWSTDKCQVVE